MVLGTLALLLSLFYQGGANVFMALGHGVPPAGPGVCAPVQFYNDVDAGTLYYCDATTYTWTLVNGGSGGGGITSINGNTSAAQTIDKVDDTNVTMTITQPTAAINRLTLGWTGTLANARITNPQTTVNGQTCTLGSTCTVVDGAAATKALDNLAIVSINTSLLAQTGVDLGSTTKPFREIYFFGTGTFATTYMKLTAAPTSTRVVTFPDATGTVLYNSRNISTTSPITGGGDLSADRTIACATCGVTGSPLSQFASTTSAQLAGVISDETGTNKLVFSDSPTLVTPALGTPSALNLSNATALPCGAMPALTGGVTSSAGSCATTAATKLTTKSCVVIIGDPGSASPVLANDNDSPVACANDVGSDWTLTTVACWADAGSPTVTPILTGGTSTSILTGALTCGTASWAAGTVQGTAPVVHSFSGAGATCSSTPCTIDVNITTAGGTAKYIVVKIVGTI